jgi:hypothetical protein
MPVFPQDAQGQCDALGETAADDHVTDADRRGPDPLGVGGEHLTQTRRTGRFAVAMSLRDGRQLFVGALDQSARETPRSEASFREDGSRCPARSRPDRSRPDRIAVRSAACSCVPSVPPALRSSRSMIHRVRPDHSTAMELDLNRVPVAAVDSTSPNSPGDVMTPPRPAARKRCTQAVRDATRTPSDRDAMVDTVAATVRATSAAPAGRVAPHPGPCPAGPRPQPEPATSNSDDRDQITGTSQ